VTFYKTITYKIGNAQFIKRFQEHKRRSQAILKKVFIHGLESSSQGAKGIFFKTKYPDMIIEDFTGPFDQRMDKLRDLLHEEENLLIVGSSYGGLMASVYAFERENKVNKLILLAPALCLPEFNPYLTKELPIPVILYHGRQDDVVLPESVHDIAHKVFPNLEYHFVDDDHSLHQTFEAINWDKLLEG
jgi:pimeloyl-ACP methyl ester carboxylesterase